MHTTLRVATTAALTALAVTACGGSSPPPSSTPPASPSASMFTSTDFTASIPDGWSDQTTNESAVTSVSVNGTVLMLLVPPASFSARENEHIDVSVVQQPVPSDQLSPYLQSVAQHGATNVSTVQAFNLDGATGLFVTYDLTANGSTNHAQDMVVDRNNNTYDIVLNTAGADFAAQLPALQHLLNSWRWAS